MADYEGYHRPSVPCRTSMDLGRPAAVFVSRQELEQRRRHNFWKYSWNSKVPTSIPPRPKTRSSLIWALFCDVGGIDGGTLEAYELQRDCVLVSLVVISRGRAVV